MSDILAALPGTPMRVSEVIPSLAAYWQESAGDGVTSRASQMNLVVIFGSAVKPAEAASMLESALTLSHRYPCRILALCPDDTRGAAMSARMQIMCFAASNGRDQQCGEALSLGFPVDIDPAVLDSQVSVWLESDIPTYVWLHGVVSGEVGRYAPLLRPARRVIYDSSVCLGDFSTVWPKADVVRDLAHARLLAVRQALGQFLAGYSPQRLVTGLRDVVVLHAPSRAGEAHRLLAWLRAGLESSATRACLPSEAVFRIEARSDCDACLSTAWSYANGDFVKWDHAPQGSGAHLSASIGGESFTYPLRVPFLDQPAALAEALFY